MLRFIIHIIFFFLFAIPLSGQDSTLLKTDTLADKFYILENVKRDGVAMPEIVIDEVSIVRRMTAKQRFKWWRYRRLVHNVKRVYPYSIMVREKLSEVNDTLIQIPDDKERRRYLRKFEKDIFSEYEDDMKQMTITQGRILIKLIDRETQNSSYKLIQDYRGKVSAFFWQGIARLFGTNLKASYEPDGADYLIEKVIYEIEAGRINADVRPGS